MEISSAEEISSVARAVGIIKLDRNPVSSRHMESFELAEREVVKPHS